MESFTFNIDEKQHSVERFCIPISVHRYGNDGLSIYVLPTSPWRSQPHQLDDPRVEMDGWMLPMIMMMKRTAKCGCYCCSLLKMQTVCAGIEGEKSLFLWQPWTGGAKAWKAPTSCQTVGYDHNFAFCRRLFSKAMLMAWNPISSGASVESFSRKCGGEGARIFSGGALPVTGVTFHHSLHLNTTSYKYKHTYVMKLMHINHQKSMLMSQSYSGSYRASLPNIQGDRECWRGRSVCVCFFSMSTRERISERI